MCVCVMIYFGMFINKVLNINDRAYISKLGYWRHSEQCLVTISFLPM